MNPFVHALPIGFLLATGCARGQNEEGVIVSDGVVAFTHVTVPRGAGEPTIACDSARLASVDFMRGRWQVRSREPAHSPPRERTGTATVTAIAGRCALREDLRLGRDFEEIRILAFDERGGIWQLAIVDSEHGNIVTMTGHAVDGGLDFISTHQRRDALVVDRVAIRRTRLGWRTSVETASAYGAPWRLLQEISYRRDP